ncbi:NUDIX hydrolase [Streptomyces sp. NPDC087263]|uniref:NUDIX hydrolase n=1 Tax=Streptomyces sp. NPDC087263 TaxID=3365773 RepID=UPI00380EA98B
MPSAGPSPSQATTIPDRPPVLQNETLTAAVHRKLREETGLTVTRFLVGGESGSASGVETSVLMTSHPLVCVTDSAQNHIGLCVVVEMSGESQETAEATGHAWFTPSELVSLLPQSRILPLNIPMVRAFLDSAADKSLTLPHERGNIAECL